jgi:hypothetical protein
VVFPFLFVSLGLLFFALLIPTSIDYYHIRNICMYFSLAMLGVSSSFFLSFWFILSITIREFRSFIYLVAYVLLLPFVVVGVIVTCLACGPGFALGSLIFSVSGEATPPGAWKIWNFEPNIQEADLRDSNPAFLLHSTAYQD